MNPQCGNCKWWDRENLEEFEDYNLARCLYPIPKLPASLTNRKQTEMPEHQGQNCPVYEERKECEG